MRNPSIQVRISQMKLCLFIMNNSASDTINKLSEIGWQISRCKYRRAHCETILF